jgi:hypothetical protein
MFLSEFYASDTVYFEVVESHMILKGTAVKVDIVNDKENGVEP